MAGYVEEERMPFIMKACRLKAYDGLFTSMPKAPRLERLWVDEHYNSVRIHRDKRLKFIFNDLSIQRHKIVTTDIYANVEMTDLPKISKLAYLAILHDEDAHNPAYLVSFLGQDNFLRTRIYTDGGWQIISPLYLGFKLLKMIASNLETNYFIDIDQKTMSPTLPLVCGRQWIAMWPPHKHTVSVINREKPFLLEQLGIQ